MATTLEAPAVVPPATSPHKSSALQTVLEVITPFVFFALSAMLFAGVFLLDPHYKRTIDKDTYEMYEGRLMWDDTAQYTKALDDARDGIRRGEKFYSVNEFDLPISYLAVCGSAMVVTGCDAMTALNLFFVGIFFLNGLAAYCFLRVYLNNVFFSLVGGIIYQTANYVFAQHYLGHMNQVQVCYIPLAFLCVYQLAVGRASFVWSVGLGVVMAVQILSSPYYTLFLGTVALPVFLVSLYITHIRATLPVTPFLKLVVHGVIAVGVALGLSAFYLIERLQAEAEIFDLSWVQASGFTLDNPIEFVTPTHGFLYVGFPLLGLAVLAMRWVFTNPGPKWTTVAITAFVSMVMMIPAFTGTPYWCFYQVVPMADRLRVPERFFPIFFLMLLALVFGYLDHELRGRKWWLKTSVVTLFLASVVVLNFVYSPWVFGEAEVKTVSNLLFRNE